MKNERLATNSRTYNTKNNYTKMEFGINGCKWNLLGIFLDGRLHRQEDEGPTCKRITHFVKRLLSCNTIR